MKQRSKKCQPFIKWVGGKRNLLHQILPLLPDDFNAYHEPFLGGAALFFELFSMGKLKNKEVYLSDINTELINAYQVVKTNPEKLIEELLRFKQNHSETFYHEALVWDRKTDFAEMCPIKRAARFIYLNKTCYNGLYRVNQKGFFNVPMGRYKDPKICDSETIFACSYALKHATIEHVSYQKVIHLAKANDLVYFDPPYYPLNKTSSFTAYSKNSFSQKEQTELFETFDVLAQRNVWVFLSNSSTPFIMDLFKKYPTKTLEAHRFINCKGKNRSKVNEILVCPCPHYNKLEPTGTKDLS